MSSLSIFLFLAVVACSASISNGSTVPQPLVKNIFKTTLSRYSTFASARPVASNVVQGAVLFAGGDLIAQMLQPEQDPSRQTAAARGQRALTSGTFGGAYVGGVVSQFYRFIDNVVPSRIGPMGKVAGTCMALGIVGNTANMFCRRVARTGSPEEAWRFTKSRIKTVVMHDFKVWPAFDLICFGYVPKHLRPATAGVASMMWNTYLSVASNAH